MKKSYPNQKKIFIQKIEPKDKYLKIDNNDWINAYRILSPSAFGVFLYLSRLNQDAIESIGGWNLSRVDVMNNLGMCEKSYKSAVKELIRVGYIKLEKGNVYVFNPSYTSIFNGVNSTLM